MKFQATILPGGKTATGIEVPGDVLAALGGGKRPRVKVTINGYTYRSTVGSMGGRSLVPVSAEVRSRSGVQAGDRVEVEVVADTEARTVDVPADSQAPCGAIQKLSAPGSACPTAPSTGTPSPSSRPRQPRPAAGALQRVIDELGNPA